MSSAAAVQIHIWDPAALVYLRPSSTSPRVYRGIFCMCVCVCVYVCMCVPDWLMCQRPAIMEQARTRLQRKKKRPWEPRRVMPAEIRVGRLAVGQVFNPAMRRAGKHSGSPSWSSARGHVARPPPQVGSSQKNSAEEGKWRLVFLGEQLHRCGEEPGGSPLHHWDAETARDLTWALEWSR